MKILQLIHATQLRGAEIFASQLSGHLHDKGHEVMIVSMYDGGMQLPVDLPVHVLNAKNAFDVLAMKRLVQIIRSNNISVVQANAGDTLQFCIMAKRLFGIRAKIIFRNASTISRYIKGSSHKVWYRLMLNAVDHIVSVSETSAKDISELYPSIQHKVSVVPIGLQSQRAIVEIHRSVTPMILHVGGFSFEKDHHALIRIFQQVLKEVPNAELYLVGSGILQPEIRQLVADQQLNDKVHFLGHRSDVMNIMRQASVFALPSKIEGLPGVILEAMYCELPVVSNDVGGIHEIVDHNKTGWLIPAGNEDAFAQQLIRVLTGQEDITTIVKNAKEMVDWSFRNETIAEKFLAIYDHVLNDHLHRKAKLQVS